MPNPYITLAKNTIKTFIKEGKVIAPPPDLPKEMLEKRAGTFVTLHKKSTKELRGCVGTFIPTCKNIAFEIIQNAISASTKDPRFPPVSANELEDLEIKVDILSSPEPTTEDQLDPQKYGLIVKGSDGRAGLLLPGIPSIKTPEQQIEVCKQKAFIGKDEPVQLFRFTVKRHEE
jgi:hypothetical protein